MQNDASKKFVSDLNDTIFDYRNKPSNREESWKSYCRSILNDQEFAIMFPNG